MALMRKHFLLFTVFIYIQGGISCIVLLVLRRMLAILCMRGFP